MITTGCVRNAYITVLAPNFDRSYAQITGVVVLRNDVVDPRLELDDVLDARQVDERPFHLSHESGHSSPHSEHDPVRLLRPRLE